MDSLLSVRHFSVGFATKKNVVPAVKDISFDIGFGEIVGIVGESGSGKSVTALSILQLLDAAAVKYHGDIFFTQKNGKLVSALQSDDKVMQHIRGAEIGMIFQEPMSSLNPVYTCGEQVIETLTAHFSISRQAAKERTIELFRQVQLPDPENIIKRYPHELSGGQKQRVMIAIALACEPQLLIADEPTTALDVTVQRSILELLKQLQQRNNMSIIFITHDLGVVAAIASRVLVMQSGKIVEDGTIEKIFTQPAHPYTKGLLACRPDPGKQMRRLPVMNEQLEVAFEKNDIHISENKFSSKKPADATTKDTLLEVKNLSVTFSQKKNFRGKATQYYYAVDNINFVVKKGETVGLVGESGCGKTTLSRAILRLADLSAGEIIYAGENLVHVPVSSMRALRRKMQIIFQDPYSSLNPRQTIGEAITEPMRVHRLYEKEAERKTRAIALLGKVGLKPEHFNRYPHEFSGGQRQRICIARALAVEPDFIICDESVAALDVSIQAQVLNLLKDLQDELNLTYIFISHDLSVVKFMSDRILVMQKGRIVEQGFTDQVYHAPQTDYTRELIRAIPSGRYLHH